MPKGDQARAHLIGISTAGASPRRMVILIELRTYTVPGCSGSIVSSSHRLAKKKKKVLVHRSNKQLLDWNASGTRRDRRADLYSFTLDFSVSFILSLY